MIVVALLCGACATMPPEETGEVELSLCSGLQQKEAQGIAEDWLIRRYGGQSFDVLEWSDPYEGTYTGWKSDGERFEATGCLLECWVRPSTAFLTGEKNSKFMFLFQEGKLIAAKDITPQPIHVLGSAF
jgi:hypothetical protein